MPSATALLLAAVAADPARPRLTWYDDASGERVELSGRTLQNWVAKTAHLLAGDLGAGPGSRVAVALPAHWTAAVWWLAVDAVGAELVDVGDAHGSPFDVAVIGPAALPAPPPAGEVVAVSLRPMAAPFADPLPPLVLDFSAEVRAQPDDYAFDADRGTPDGAAATRQAAAWRLAAADRVLLLDGPSGPMAPVTWLTAAIAADASCVWVRNPTLPFGVERLVAEQVTAVVDAQDQTWPGTIRTLRTPSVS